MGTLPDTVGFVIFSCLSIQVGFSLDGKFTDFPSNITAREGQNIEMACAFQSGLTSVYLEIQWWFIRAPEELITSEEEEDEDQPEMELIPDPDPDEEGTKISTVKVQGNDISHKLQIARVSKNDEGLYECRVTDANYGELKEYKAQAYLKVNGSMWTRNNRAMKKSSPLHLTDTKPRKHTHNPEQRSPSSSTSQNTHSRAEEHSTASGSRRSSRNAADLLLFTSFLLRAAWL